MGNYFVLRHQALVEVCLALVNVKGFSNWIHVLKGESKPQHLCFKYLMLGTSINWI